MSEAAPKRRWFRFAFNLRCLFVLVTVFGAWLGWHLHVVRGRQLVLQELKQQLGPDLVCLTLEMAERKIGESAVRKKVDLEFLRVSRVRRLLGDESCFTIRLERMPDLQLVERMEVAFPEANLEIWGGPETHSLIASRDSLYRPDRYPNSGTVFKTGIPK